MSKVPKNPTAIKRAGRPTSESGKIGIKKVAIYPNGKIATRLSGYLPSTNMAEIDRLTPDEITAVVEKRAVLNEQVEALVNQLLELLPEKFKVDQLVDDIKQRQREKDLANPDLLIIELNDSKF